MKNNQAMRDLLELVREKGRENVDYAKFVQQNVLHKGDKLFYLCLLGSHLYGLDNEDSDYDIKGLFFPSEESLLLEEQSDQYGQYSTGGDDIANTKEDIDLELWSIQKFMKLLQKGDSNAYDLLFSISNPDIELTDGSNLMMDLYLNREYFIGSKPILKSFIGYAYGQYKKYELKTLNFKTLRYIMKFFKDIEDEYKSDDRVKEYIDELLNEVENVIPEYSDEMLEDHLMVIEDEKDTYLYINKHKQFPVGIRIKQFLDNIQTYMNQYGSRVKNGEGIDYTSISHAYRCLYVAEKLAVEGDVKYPLEDVEFDGFNILDIKNGKYDFKELVVNLNKEVDRVADLLRESEVLRTKPKADKMKRFILDVYGGKYLTIGL